MTATRLPPLPIGISVTVSKPGRCEATIRVGSEAEPGVRTDHLVYVTGLADAPSDARLDALANLEEIVKRVREVLTS